MMETCNFVLILARYLPSPFTVRPFAIVKGWDLFDRGGQVLCFPFDLGRLIPTLHVLRSDNTQKYMLETYA